MRIEDLGRVDGEWIAFGGCVSNRQAAAAMLDALAGRLAVCTGDLAAYCADPAGTVALIRAWGGPVVAGNCERNLAARAPGCGCGFGAGTACDAMAGAWWARCDAEVGEADRAWMAGLPDMVVLDHEGVRTAVIHGGVRDVARFLWPVSPPSAFAEEVAAIEALAGRVDRVVAGHCGVPFARRVAGVEWVNAGSAGMPPHDGRPLGRYARIRPGGVLFERLAYDHAAAAAAMRAAGLAQGYDRALETGLWPSEDVLPGAMRRAG
ncbi:calcineurin-like phosphoesterase family protein [Hasllibacter halocynthiae]|uniref:Calcineurin-like phosphoesterase family protein n=1 Tax=Hasllibacter halocynthiae TaxID=595589 RepID=A0A2T0X8R8_9RHOB|nr:metallophosphoesterase family protein [Hasllibacter halocynthiae]PRY95342.1 calcineurin-like phosphoesterase family protein [Hasllibacter halocynthiae]